MFPCNLNKFIVLLFSSTKKLFQCFSNYFNFCSLEGKITFVGIFISLTIRRTNRNSTIVWEDGRAIRIVFLASLDPPISMDAQIILVNNLKWVLKMKYFVVFKIEDCFFRGGKGGRGAKRLFRKSIGNIKRIRKSKKKFQLFDTKEQKED